MTTSGTRTVRYCNLLLHEHHACVDKALLYFQFRLLLYTLQSFSANPMVCLPSITSSYGCFLHPPPEAETVAPPSEWTLGCAGNNAGLLETLWQAADDTMQLSECEAYSYSEDRDTSHPATDQPGSLWSFTVFLINKRLNRILCLSCYARAKHASDASYSYSSSEEDYSDMQAENTDASSTLFGIEV